MVMGYIMQEKPALPAEKVTVDGASSSSLKRPLSLPKVWKVRVCVVKICNHNKLPQTHQYMLL
jgi:hypothetical protein